mgnify:CR=1 FL=1
MAIYNKNIRIDIHRKEVDLILRKLKYDSLDDYVNHKLEEDLHQLFRKGV